MLQENVSWRHLHVPVWLWLSITFQQATMQSKGSGSGRLLGALLVGPLTGRKDRSSLAKLAWRHRGQAATERARNYTSLLASSPRLERWSGQSVRAATLIAAGPAGISSSPAKLQKLLAFRQ